MAKYKVELTGVNTSELKVLTSEETKIINICCSYDTWRS